MTAFEDLHLPFVSGSDICKVVVWSPLEYFVCFSEGGGIGRDFLQTRLFCSTSRRERKSASRLTASRLSKGQELDVTVRFLQWNTMCTLLCLVIVKLTHAPDWQLGAIRHAHAARLHCTAVCFPRRHPPTRCPSAVTLTSPLLQCQSQVALIPSHLVALWQLKLRRAVSTRCACVGGAVCQSSHRGSGWDFSRKFGLLILQDKVNKDKLSIRLRTWEVWTVTVK